MLAIALLMLFLGLLSSDLLWKFKKDPFLASEANRCLNNFCEVDDSWSSRGRMYTRGLAVIEVNGVKKFVRQAKLVDIGILE